MGLRFKPSARGSKEETMDISVKIEIKKIKTGCVTF